MLKFKLESGAELPQRGSENAAGLDIRTTEGKRIQAGKVELLRTGVFLADCPHYIYLRVAPRSKLAYRYGLNVLGGVIDADYRGEICVLLHNTQDSNYYVVKGERVAQLIPTKIELFDPIEVKSVSISARGADGTLSKELRL